jgi:pyochelin biosynthesis protein PchG
MTDTTRWKVAVCGTKFGRVYLSAIADKSFPMDLVAVVGAGSERSKECADRYRVPLITKVEDLPADTNAACVVIGSELGGGPGTRIAKSLLSQGIAVLQEHPMHHDELVDCIRTAHQSKTVHQMNTLYPHIQPIRQFLTAARSLIVSHPPLYVDAMCSIQLKTSLLDIVGRAIGRLSPWNLEAVENSQDDNRSPFRILHGTIGGVPTTIRLQNQLHISDPDNHAHVYHRVTIGTDVGSLTLVDTHGPVVWSPRPHIPQAIQRGTEAEDCDEPALDYPTATNLTGDSSTWREAMTTVWPDAIQHALLALKAAASGNGAGDSHYQLALTRIVQDVGVALGPPELLHGDSPTPMSAAPLMAAIASA